jgi:endonuclease III
MYKIPTIIFTLFHQQLHLFNACKSLKTFYIQNIILGTVNMSIELTNKIVIGLKSKWPNPKVELDYSNAYELLVATILSAQSTDVKVNEVTKELFKIYPTLNTLACANIKDVITIIRPTGFFNNKSKNLINCCKILAADFNGNVPSNMNDLVRLPGVGRKTANVILGTIYKIPGIVVDTHMTRVSNRLGLSTLTNAEKIEMELAEKVEKSNWIDFSILMVLHGRYDCKSKKPNCNGCVINNLCKWSEKVN